MGRFGIAKVVMASSEVGGVIVSDILAGWNSSRAHTKHEVKRRNKVVKKELIVTLRGEIYFVKFIINPEEDDVEPRVIFDRSFLRLTKAITDFGDRTITIYPDIDPFLEETEEEEKSKDDWDHLLDFNIDDIPLLGEEGLPPFICKMGKTGGHLTQEEETKEAISIRMSRKFALFEEERPIIETMAYNDKYKKILDEVWKDRVELDGKIVKEEEEAVKRIKEEALKEKEDPGAFMFPIRLEGQVNENALVDTGSNINTMPFRIFMQLGRDVMNKVDGGITMINHTQEEAIRILTNVLCQVGVTTLIAKFLILDIPIDHDLPIVVGRGFLHTIGGIVNAPERLFSTFDGFYHQTFHDARSDFMRNVESDSDDEEDYQIKRNKFGAPIYGPKPAPYLNCNDPDERSLKEHMMMMPDHHDPNAQDNMKPWKNYFFHKFTMNFCYGKDVAEMKSLEIDDLLRIRLREARSDEEIFTSVAWIRAFNINEPIYAELCHEFYSTYEFDEVCADDELQSKKIIKFRLGGRAHNLTLLEFARRLGLYQAVELEEEGFNVYFEGGLRNDDNFNAQDYWLSISREDNLGLSRSHTSTIRNLILRDTNVAWVIARWMKRKGVGTQKESQICCGQFISKLARKCRVLTEDVVRSLSALIYCRDLDTTTLIDLIESDGKLILEDP
ncbi:putative reverse transcriptase, RNA-dependent DNA polymerase [Tanacetum coccineum]